MVAYTELKLKNAAFKHMSFKPKLCCKVLFVVASVFRAER